MNIAQMKEFLEKMLDRYKREMNDTKNLLKQVSDILEKETYLQGGWPDEFWSEFKKNLQARKENLKQSIETLKKIRKYTRA